MRRFLRELQRFRRPVLPRLLFEEKIGAGSFEVLQRHRIVMPALTVDSWPCGGTWTEDCPRRLIEATPPTLTPYLAVCVASPMGCPAISLSENDVKTFATSLENFGALLRNLLTITPGPTLRGATASGYEPLHLGTVGLCGNQREVLLAPQPLDPTFEPFVHGRSSSGLGTTLLVPSGWRLPFRLLEQHGPGNRTEIICLDQMLTIRDQAITTTVAGLLLPVDRRMGPSQEPAPAPVFCEGIHQLGRSELTEVGYWDIIRIASTHDLLVDVASSIDGGHYAVYHKDEEGAPICTPVSPVEAFALIRLMIAGEALLARDLGLSRTRPQKAFEALRRKIERPPRRGGWTALKTKPGNTPEELRYQFLPPADYRWAILRPLGSTLV